MTMTRPARKRFRTELIQGHKGITAVIVPFDPEQVWGQKPVKLDPRREGWLVRGTVNRVRFEGWIGYRWGRFFIIIDPALRGAADVEVGDILAVSVEPTRSETALAIAREQARQTTAPGRSTRSARPRARSG